MPVSNSPTATMSVWSSFQKNWQAKRDVIYSGTAAAMTVSLFSYPFDTVKSRLQFSRTVEGATQYKGTWDVLRTVARDEGAPRLYRGWLIRATQILCMSSFQFFGIEMWADSVSRKQDYVSGAAILLGIRAAETTIRNPLDVVKQRMQVDGSLKAIKEKEGIRGSLRTLIRTDGVQGLFQGVVISCMRDIPFTFLLINTLGMYRSLYRNGSLENWSPSLRPKPSPRGKDHSYIEAFLPTIPAIFTTLLVTHPLDVIRTKLQTQSLALLAQNYQAAATGSTGSGLAPSLYASSSSIPTAGGVLKYKGIWHAVQLITKEEGLRGFTVGFLPHFTRLLPLGIVFGLQQLYLPHMRRVFGMDK